jgi:hypothetical protein
MLQVGISRRRKRTSKVLVSQAPRAIHVAVLRRLLWFSSHCCSSLPISAVLCAMVQFSAHWCSSLRIGAVLCSLVQFSAHWCSSLIIAAALFWMPPLCADFCVGRFQYRLLRTKPEPWRWHRSRTKAWPRDGLGGVFRRETTSKKYAETLECRNWRAFPQGV